MQITHDMAIGGLQRVVATLCRCIDREAFDVSVLCLRELGPFAAEVRELGIDVRLIQQTGGTDYLSFLKVAKALRSERVDVIHTHNTQPFIDGTLGSLLAGRAPIVHTDHARESSGKLRYRVAEAIASRLAYRVVGVSAHTTASLASHLCIRPSRLETIENGILDSAPAVGFDREATRRELGLAPDARVVGLGARLTAQKGISYLLRAMPEVIGRVPNAVLVIAGEGPLASELRGEAVRLGVGRHVVFLGPRVDMPALYRAFDLYVLPSVWEGLPMVLLEAMAAGCPIVASDVGGVTSAIESGISGLLVPARQPTDLARAIVRVLQDEALRQGFAREASRRFETHFTASVMTRRYESLYAAAMAARR
jgi:glycosyltransferase involved in cell wall biosynthesis